MDTTLSEVEARLRANQPLIAVQTLEESRTTKALIELSRQIAIESGKPLSILTWDCVSGLVAHEGPAVGILETLKTNKPGALNLLSAVQAIDESRVTRALILVMDSHRVITSNASEGTTFRRIIKKAVVYLTEAAQLHIPEVTIVALDHTMPTHPFLEEYLVGYTWPLPDKEELSELFMDELGEVTEEDDAKLAASPHPWNSAKELCDRFAEASQGLKASEAVLAFVNAVTGRRITDLDPRAILQAKKSLIARSGVLTYYDSVSDLTAIGGLGRLKAWLKVRRKGFSDTAKAYGLPAPKGVLLVGPPGTGKSVVAKTVGAEWGYPVVKLDVGQLMGSLLGSSEANLRNALATAQAAAPCILWIDEIDKGLGKKAGDTDGGTTGRIFATWLTWMSDNQSEVFVVATANNPDALPPEATRAGRFDKIFLVDFPNEGERKEIFELHLRIRGRDPSQFSINSFVAASAGHSGAEIEGAIVTAMYNAFDVGLEDVTDDLLLASVESIRPLSLSLSEESQARAEWCRHHAEPANSPGVWVENTQDDPKKTVVKKIKKAARWRS